MSLILGVAKGDKIFLNDVIMNVLEISEDLKDIKVSIKGATYDLDDVTFLEVSPQIFMAVGKPRYETHGTLARIAINAPRSVKILRGSLKDSDDLVRTSNLSYDRYNKAY